MPERTKLARSSIPDILPSFLCLSWMARIVESSMGGAKGGSSAQVPPVSLSWIQGNLLEGGSPPGSSQP